MNLRIRPEWRDGNTRILALLVVLTILPAACVLWFMNAAVTNDAAVAQERILTAYRGQLHLVRSRLDALWRAQAERLNAAGDPSKEFQRLITGELAEGAVLLDASGYVAFPWTDVRGDLAAIDARVAAAGRLAPPVRDAAVRDIADRLNDYSRHLPAGDRLRLMDDLRRLAPNVWLPTQAALQLSLDMVDAERPEPVPNVVRKTSVPDVWALTSADRRTIAASFAMRFGWASGMAIAPYLRAGCVPDVSLDNASFKFSEVLGERTRWRIERSADRVFGDEPSMKEHTPLFGVMRRMRRDARTSFFQILVHAHGAAVGKSMRKRNFRRQQFQSIAVQSQLFWSGREIGKLVPESVQVGMKIRQRNLFRDRQTADVFICF